VGEVKSVRTRGLALTSIPYSKNISVYNW